MHSLRNSPPDCFSQMLALLEPRVSCTACNSLGRQIAAPTRPTKYGYATIPKKSTRWVLFCFIQLYLFVRAIGRIRRRSLIPHRRFRRRGLVPHRRLLGGLLPIGSGGTGCLGLLRLGCSLLGAAVAALLIRPKIVCHRRGIRIVLAVHGLLLPAGRCIGAISAILGHTLRLAEKVILRQLTGGQGAHTEILIIQRPAGLVIRQNINAGNPGGGIRAA